jgi:hypothetical protein
MVSRLLTKVVPQLVVCRVRSIDRRAHAGPCCVGVARPDAGRMVRERPGGARQQEPTDP